MKRKTYRDRTQVLVSVERDRWKDFEDLCDREKKSMSLKINELLQEELEKNAVGPENPLKISYNKRPQKPLEMNLDRWINHIKTVDDHRELQAIKGDAMTLMKTVDVRSKDLYRKGIRKGLR